MRAPLRGREERVARREVHGLAAAAAERAVEPVARAVLGRVAQQLARIAAVLLAHGAQALPRRVLERLAPEPVGEAVEEGGVRDVDAREQQPPHAQLRVAHLECAQHAQHALEPPLAVLVLEREPQRPAVHVVEHRAERVGVDLVVVERDHARVGAARRGLGAAVEQQQRAQPSADAAEHDAVRGKPAAAHRDDDVAQHAVVAHRVERSEQRARLVARDEQRLVERRLRAERVLLVGLLVIRVGGRVLLRIGRHVVAILAGAAEQWHGRAVRRRQVRPHSPRHNDGNCRARPAQGCLAS